MGQLCIYLPPFACDYSGVCSALFDLNCMTAINDASCCTGHYVYYDEPRWTQNIKPIFSTALRTIDAVLGNDNKIIDSICAAAESLNSQMISVVGTPVPAITGMDMDGVAAEIENRTGKLSFGFNTTGFSYYDHGVAKAGKALISRLATPCPPDKQRVNIVGMTPLDFGTHGNDTALQSLLNANGWQIGCNFFMGMTTAQIQKCAAAKVNLAVSAAGLAIAKYLQQRFGTPYITGFPMGSKHGRILMDAVDGRPTKMPQETPAAGQKLLIISDQILGNSLRAALRLSGYAHGINVASFFGWDK
ncbi:MAG: nitrogenase component 1, partial [Clostridiales bacterium]